MEIKNVTQEQGEQLIAMARGEQYTPKRWVYPNMSEGGDEQ